MDFLVIPAERAPSTGADFRGGDVRVMDLSRFMDGEAARRAAREWRVGARESSSGTS